MKRFSQKYGFTQVRDKLQIESMDHELRVSLWNALTRSYWNTFDESINGCYFDEHNLLNRKMKQLYNLWDKIWGDFFYLSTDSMPIDWRVIYKRLKKYYNDCEWYEVYDFIQYISGTYSSENVNKKFRHDCNKILEREMSAYRFVGKTIAPISNSSEIEAIEEAIKSSNDQVRDHLNNALEKLSDRRKPDYRNSIKESISSVESIVNEFMGEKGTLGRLLKKIDSHVEIHPSLKRAFTSLYGYTSDKDGIRHALIEEDTTDFEDAKFMLVTCSAFVNYVRGKLKQEEKELDSETSSE